jgi:flagellin
MSDISLSKAVRSNLLSLQNTADMMATTQERLSTGNKVNSALDNPTNFFTASSLNSRAGDLNALMDSMANGIQTLEAADNGLTAITRNLESMQSTLRQARQDKSFQTSSMTMPTALDVGTDDKKLSFSGGAIGTTPIEINLIKDFGVAAAAAEPAELEATAFTALAAGETASFTISDGTNSVAVSLDDVSGASLAAAQAEIQDQLDAAGVKVTVGDNAGADGFKFTSTALGTSASVEISNVTAPATTGELGFVAASDAGVAAIEGVRAKKVDELVAEINASNSPLKGMVRASNDNGKLRIENLSTQELDIDGVGSSGAIDGTSTDSSSIAGNNVRAGLADQFNELRDQLDKLSDDASFNGINLLRGDLLRITFNETGTSSIDIQTKDEGPLNSASLNIFDIQASDLDSDDGIDASLANIKLALNDVRSQSGTFGSNLSIVQNRQDFTKEMINTLETGGANLTLADMNEEAANLLALQTRQSLSSSSLSLASQADQSVLQLLQ